MQRAGQATFIPLETIQAKPVNDKFRSFARGARLAIDVITYDPSVEKAMQHACGNALVCDTMEIARHVCYDKGQEIKGASASRSALSSEATLTGIFRSRHARRNHHPPEWSHHWWKLDSRRIWASV